MKPQIKYTAIAQHAGKYPIAFMCNFLRYHEVVTMRSLNGKIDHPPRQHWLP